MFFGDLSRLVGILFKIERRFDADFNGANAALPIKIKLFTEIIAGEKFRSCSPGVGLLVYICFQQFLDGFS
jgi:hypothetical protein